MSRRVWKLRVRSLHRDINACISEEVVSRALVEAPHCREIKHERVPSISTKPKKEVL